MNRLVTRVVWVAGALAAAAWAPSVRAEAYAWVYYDGFEDCPLAFPDPDGDGFGGAVGVRHLCDPLPAGFVRQGGDCAEGDPSIPTLLPELEPDGDYQDEDCDGIDGTAALAIFVAEGAKDSADCGTQAVPCGSISHAVQRAVQEARQQIYVGAGTYPGVLALEAGLRIFGGYDAAWQRGHHGDPAHRATLLGARDDAGDGEFLAVRAHDFGGAALLDNLEIHAPPALERDKSSYAVHVANANLTLRNVDVFGNDGATGQPGTPGLSASQTPAPQGNPGGSAGSVISPCNSSTRGMGGGAALYTCPGPGRDPRGGGGGAGGTQDTSCPFDLDATPGVPGLNAAYSQALAGRGGSGGSECSQNPNPLNGQPGASTHGAGGAGGTGMVRFGRYIFGNPGDFGALGEHGGGGGGGGGSGGCDTGQDSFGAGGGSGGAGGCSALQPGLGGGGGGGSFGVVAFDGAFVTLEACNIVLGQGGTGGSGGSGGLGQPGGPGGAGGMAAGDSGPGGRGGDGGRGGHSGGGGGGAGGSAYGTLRSRDSVIDGACAVTAGMAGLGGNGGFSPHGPSHGLAGQAGQVGAARVCEGPVDC